MLFGLWWENLSTYAGFSHFGLSKGKEWDRDRVQKISFRLHITCSLLIGSFVRLVEFYFGVFRNERSFAFFLYSFRFLHTFSIYWNDKFTTMISSMPKSIFFPRKLCSHCNRSFSVISRSKCEIIYHCKLFSIFLYCIAMWGVCVCVSTLESLRKIRDMKKIWNKFRCKRSCDSKRELYVCHFWYSRCESLLIKIFIRTDFMTLQIINRKTTKRVCKVHNGWRVGRWRVLKWK